MLKLLAITMMILSLSGCGVQWPVLQKEVDWAIAVCRQHGGTHHLYSAGAIEGSYTTVLCTDMTKIEGAVE